MSDRKSQIEKDIENARKELEELINARDIISRFILEASQRLDSLIVEYTKENEVSKEVQYGNENHGSGKRKNNGAQEEAVNPYRRVLAS